MEQPRIRRYDTLVLSGGGIKGYLLLGAIQSGLDMEIFSHIKTYIGTSIGSIIGYLLAIGYTPEELIKIIHLNKWMEKQIQPNLVAMIQGNGAVTFLGFQDILEKLTLNKIGQFMTLKGLQDKFDKTLICTTYNATTCQGEYLSPESHPDMPCLVALRMSCNIPLVFDRYKYLDNFYIDGGIFDNFPILYAEKVGEKIFGLNLEISPQSLQDRPEDGVLPYIVRLLQTPMSQMTKHQLKKLEKDSTVLNIHCEKLISGIEFIKSKDGLELFSLGYKQMTEFLKVE